MNIDRLKDIYFQSFYNIFFLITKTSKKEMYLYSHGGEDIGNNMYHLLIKIDQNYLSFGIKRVVVDIRCTKSAAYRLLKRNLTHLKVRTVSRNWARNAYHMARAKYFFTDTDFPVSFRKKKSQKVVQTWHGTPLKKLGYENKRDIYWTGNQKKAFLLSDSILFPNQFTAEVMTNSYKLKKNVSGKIFYGGYPRNGVLFNENKRNEIRSYYHLENKEVFIYMPTWRGVLLDIQGKSSEFYADLFAYIDDKLKENQILYVKLHRLDMMELDCSQFNHIKKMPEDSETYCFLTAVDCLITDYSSILFDFSVTKRKILLFPYDLKNYEAEQGFYFPYHDLPFPTAYTKEELTSLICSCDYNSDIADKFFEKFCCFDSLSNADHFLQKIFSDDTNPEEEKTVKNDLFPKILLYAGAMSPSDQTARMYYFLDQIQDRFNITIAYKNEDFKSNPSRIQALPPQVDLFSFDFEAGSYCRKSLLETIAGVFERKFKKKNIFHKIYKNMCIREINRCAANQSFDLLIVYSYDESDLQILRMFANTEIPKVLVKTDGKGTGLLSNWVTDLYEKFDKIIEYDQCNSYLLHFLENRKYFEKSE